jgi:hypothetical protein
MKLRFKGEERVKYSLAGLAISIRVVGKRHAVVFDRISQKGMQMLGNGSHLGAN